MNTTAVRSEWAGRVVDERFALLEWLGGSGSSGAFLTELPEDRLQKAVVKLTPVDAADAEALTAGWEVAAGLSHPHLMRLFDTGRCEIDGVSLLFTVTEYADEVLSQILSERALTPDETREMLDPILDALAYLHRKGLVHGHVKPSNIMVVGDQVKLSSDCVQAVGARSESASSSGVYDAPETEGGTISAAADVWSLGVVVVEALTRLPPLWDRSANAEPVVAEALPQPFAGIARECLRREPAQRCTVSDIKARLRGEHAVPGLSIVSDTPESETGEARAFKRNWAIPAAAVFFVIVIVAVLLLRSHQVEPGFQKESQPLVMTTPAPSTQPSATGAQAVKGVVKGSVVEQVQPKVSAGAKASIQGTVHVKIRVAVDSSGKVLNATFDSHGPSKYFAEVAEQAARHWTFKPAQVGSQPAASEWVLQFQFRQSGTEVSPVETSP